MWIQLREARITSQDFSQQACRRKSRIRFAFMMMSFLTLTLAASAGASVVINSPSSGANVSGTVIVKAQITSAYWSKLWIDGNGGPTAPTGLVTFTWNSTSVSDGSHVFDSQILSFGSIHGQFVSNDYRGGQ
jgi:hypothetical protein